MAADHFSALIRDLQLHILSLLAPQDLLSCACVSRYFHHLTDDTALWTQVLADERFQMEMNVNEQNSSIRTQYLKTRPYFYYGNDQWLRDMFSMCNCVAVKRMNEFRVHKLGCIG